MRVKVRLKVDLTRYLSGLVAGSEGYAVGAHGMWSRSSDRFTLVDFPGIGSLDILWSSLEITDEDHLQAAEELRVRRLERFKSAKDIVKHVGPRGGFRCLSFTYTDSSGTIVHYSNVCKQQSEELIAHFRKMNLAVREIAMR